MLEHQCNKLYIVQVVDYTGKTNKLENFEKLSCLLKRARLNKSAFMSIELKMKPKEWTILVRVKPRELKVKRSKNFYEDSSVRND